MNYYFILILLLVYLKLYAQDYESFLIGDAADVSPTPTYGLCLMGGAAEDDNALIWLLNRANGGDVVVLRTSGSDGYNDYLYNQLGVNVNSVETLLINNENGATANYVLNRVSQAEMIWLAGGDQWNYVDYFKDTALEDLLNDHINQKQAPIGGTSAGMAVLSNHYFDAENGTITSAEALSHPFDSRVSIGHDDFLDLPFMQNTITDTHYDNPDRKGRHSVFLARITQQTGNYAFGLAAEEFTAICIDQNGLASVYGEYPNFNDFAYFIRANCENTNFLPENLSSGNPLTWNKNQEAIKVYKVPGTVDGNNSFDLSDWQTGSGGNWENWWIENGNFNQNAGNLISCTLGTSDKERDNITVFPNPANNVIHINNNRPIEEIALFDLLGKTVYRSSKEFNKRLDVSFLSAGIYLLQLKSIDQQQIIRVIKN